MEVVPHIHRIEASLGERFVCIFALVGSECTLVIDTGLKDMPKSVVEPYFKEHGLDLGKVRYVLITHADFDHNGGNGEMKALAPNALFLCHELDRAQIESIDAMINDRYNDWEQDHGFASSADGDNWIRSQTSDIPIDIGLTGGETLHLGGGWHVEILHTPGHSWGHVTVYDPSSKTAVIADAALYNTILKKDGSPAFPPTYRYLDTYTATIQRLQGMEIETLLTSHYPLYTGSDVGEFLSESLAYTDRVDKALADVLRSAGQPLTLKEIIAAIHTRIGNWSPGAETLLNFPLTGHLEQMTQYKKVKLGRRDGIVTYEWAGA